MSNQKWYLIASCESYESMLAMINKYYFSKEYTLRQTIENTYTIHNSSGRELANVRIINKKNRFRFEGIKY